MSEFGTVGADKRLGTTLVHHRDPQPGISRLVEAGVLELVATVPRYSYRVVQPHVHEWELRVPMDNLFRHVYLRCHCGELVKFDRNLATVEVPE